jgi:hypothetical protein
VGRPLAPDTIWTSWIRALGPDECETDPCAPCAYWHTKVRLLAGERLTDREYTWTGVGCQPATSDEGWRDAAAALQSAVTERDPRHADVGMMQALMAVGDVSTTMSEFLR